MNDPEFSNIKILQEGIGWRDADRHFCAMANAKVFIQGAGGFSYLAERVRSRRGWNTVSTLVRVPIIWLDANLELLAKRLQDEERARQKAGSVARGEVNASVLKQHSHRMSKSPPREKIQKTF